MWDEYATNYKCQECYQREKENKRLIAENAKLKSKLERLEELQSRIEKLEEEHDYQETLRMERSERR